jgi:N-acyl-D-aspartate/D-glutamate deacylase
MTFDLIIKNGTVIDGTGAARCHADIAVAGGRIVEIGDVSGTAKRVLDAGDLVVAPGFVDPHAHYDAQICWDTALTPSSWHGITSVVIGNCGVGIAPCKSDAHDVATADLVGVEGIPYNALKEGICWNWETFPEYMNAADERGCSINLGMLVALTPARHFVMGKAALERAATEDETNQIKALLKEAVSAGAIGFSTTLFEQHIGFGGKPLACRNSSAAEYTAYANALKELGRGTIQVALTRQTGVIDDEECAFLEALLRDSGHRPITWTGLIVRDDLPEAHTESLRKSESLRARGAVPQCSALPITREVSMTNPFSFASNPTFHPIFNKSKDEQLRIYRNRDFHDSFRSDLKRGKGTFSGNWSNIRLAHCVNPALGRYIGMTIAEIARIRGVDGVDTLLDIACEDNLECEFALAFANTDEARLPEIMNAPHTLIGLADGGAHVDTTCDARYSTYLLGTWVRERGIMSLERAVQKLTSEPADIFGMKDRGRLRVGNAADIVVFDPTTVGCGDRWEKRYDLPGGAKRLVIASKGIEFTIVNGVVTWERNGITDARPGRVIRG